MAYIVREVELSIFTFDLNSALCERNSNLLSKPFPPSGKKIENKHISDLLFLGALPRQSTFHHIISRLRCKLVGRRLHAMF